MKHGLRIVGFLVAAFLLSPLWAAEGDWVENGPVKARLISPVNYYSGESELPLALQLDIRKDWKTYWRVPGAAGAAPKITEVGAEFASDVVWHWPAPDTFTLLGFQSYGYEKEVVLPFDLIPTSGSVPDYVTMTATVYVCNDICLPLTFALELDFDSTSDDAIDWNMSRLYNEYRSLEPEADFAGEATAIGDESTLYLELTLPQQGEGSQVFVENLDIYEWPRPTVQVSEGRVQFWWIRSEGQRPMELTETLSFTYKDSLQAFSTQAPIITQPIPAVPVAVSESDRDLTTLFTMLLFALLGGLILNAMPCVLPILSIKLMSWLDWRQSNPGVIRAHGLATALGIISFFWLIAAVLSLLKISGAYIGWGIQFQSPWFLGLLVILMSLFLANLMGWFEIGLPEFAQSKIAGVGEQRQGFVKSYLQGGTATLMATPCSAPFLGTAVSFAFAQSLSSLWLIFTALGIGLSLPYWIVIVRPALISFLPKPGPWILVVKKILAVGLGATLIWLLYLFSDHVSQYGLIGIVFITILWLVSLRLITKTRLIPVSLIGFSVLLTITIQVFARSDTQVDVESNWEVYSAASLREHLEAQHTVLVDVTADWCLTCKFNNATVLDTQAMQSFFSTNQVVLMKADWTLPDKNTEALLSDYGRSAIPFNLVLGPGAAEGILLPELLSDQAVIDAVHQAMNRK